MDESLELLERDLFYRELEKIDLGQVRSYLVTHHWKHWKSQYDPRYQYFVERSENYSVLLPMSTTVSDYFPRLADVFRVLAASENTWYPYLLLRFIEQARK